MRTKFTSITLMVSALCFASPCFAAGAGDGLRGIDRIEKASRYAFFVDKSKGGYFCYSGYGHKIPIKGDFSYGNDSFRYWSVDDRGHSNWAPARDITEGTLTDDIKGAILDQNRFDLALTENRFFDAWSMGAETEQGILWKRIAMGKTRERVSQLVTRSILEDNPDKMAEAVGISAPFPDPIRADLTAFIEAEAASARAIHGGLAPETAARLVALRSISDRLFG